LEYWLSQYVSSYPNKNFSEAELKDYLYDDIIREKRAINQGAQMGLQELLTTAAGFSRLAQTTQPFQGGNLKFYRSMKLEELRGLLNEPTLPVRSLPNENTQLIDRIRNGNPRALGNHVGDYKQAISYTEGEAIVEFTINSMVFFSPRNLALPKDGLGDLKTALERVFQTPQNPPYQTSTASEGTNNNIPGLKSEQRGYYSVGLSNNAKAHFLNQVTSVKVVQYTKW
jgi:hypothetical protein